MAAGPGATASRSSGPHLPGVQPGRSPISGSPGGQYSPRVPSMLTLARVDPGPWLYLSGTCLHFCPCPPSSKWAPLPVSHPHGNMVP